MAGLGTPYPLFNMVFHVQTWQSWSVEHRECEPIIHHVLLAGSVVMVECQLHRQLFLRDVVISPEEGPHAEEQV